MTRNQIISSLIFIKNVKEEYIKIKNYVSAPCGETNLDLYKKYDRILNIKKSFIKTLTKINYYMNKYKEISKLKKTSGDEEKISYYENRLDGLIDSLDNMGSKLEKKLNILGSLNNLYISSKILENHIPPKTPNW